MPAGVSSLCVPSHVLLPAGGAVAAPHPAAVHGAAGSLAPGGVDVVGVRAPTSLAGYSSGAQAVEVG